MQVTHEGWYLSGLHYSRQRTAYLRDWHSHYRGLEVRVHAALADYAQETAMREASQVAMDTQQALCRRLQNKVGFSKVVPSHV